MHTVDVVILKLGGESGENLGTCFLIVSAEDISALYSLIYSSGAGVRHSISSWQFKPKLLLFKVMLRRCAVYLVTGTSIWQYSFLRSFL